VNTLEEWVAAVCGELGIGGPVAHDLILDMTRDVAHGVARPAAPLTAYLVGLAAGREADPATATEEAITRVSALVARRSQASPGD